MSAESISEKVVMILDYKGELSSHFSNLSNLSAISAALAVELSTICASSRQMRHHRSLVSGVGTICKGQALHQTSVRCSSTYHHD